MRLIITLIMLLTLSGISSAQELVIGLLPEQNVFKQMKMYQPLGDYIAKKTGMDVRFTMLPRYGNIINSFQKEEMDAAFWGSFTGALAIKQLGIEPIARPEWNDGTSTYHGHIFVRKDSGITSVADMKGRSIAFVDKATTAGYIFPLAYFREHGVKNVEGYFREHYFAGSHDAAIYAVLNGKSDVGCAKNTIFSLVARGDPRVSEELVILADSPRVPSNGLAVRKNLDPGTKRKLRDVFLGMEKDPEGRKVLADFGARRFIPTTKEDYEPVFDLAEKAGIDLEKYDYLNE